MMSPLALLNKGETGEIVNYDGDFLPARGQNCRHGHAHRHGHGACCGHCETCTCRKTGHLTSGRFGSMGLRTGQIVEMISNNGKGPIVLRVDECRIAMGRGAAMKIYVRRIEK